MRNAYETTVRPTLAVSQPVAQFLSHLIVVKPFEAEAAQVELLKNVDT